MLQVVIGSLIHKAGAVLPWEMFYKWHSENVRGLLLLLFSVSRLKIENKLEGVSLRRTFHQSAWVCCWNDQTQELFRYESEVSFCVGFAKESRHIPNESLGKHRCVTEYPDIQHSYLLHIALFPDSNVKWNLHQPSPQGESGLSCCAHCGDL